MIDQAVAAQAHHPATRSGDRLRESNVLVAIQDASERRKVAALLEQQVSQVRQVGSAVEANVYLGAEAFDAVVVGESLPECPGVDWLTRLRGQHPNLQRVLAGEWGDGEAAMSAVNRAGIAYFLRRPFTAEFVRELVDVVLPPSERSDAAAGGASSGAATRFPGIVGRSKPMVELLDMVWRVGQSDSAVIITGETGTGKELVGRAIHQASKRADRTFAAVNSAAFPEALLESELFGHRRGSFTGATENGKGLFAHADRGTVFLDEVAEMPLSMQAKLLRFLQTGEIRPVGSESARTVDTRVVSATNKDLETEIERGTFREDLYYRLAVIPIEVPPLRARMEDTPLLARHFLRSIAERAQRPCPSIDDSALDALMQHDWPGNVRELENVIERAYALSTGGRVTADDLPRMHRRSVAASEPRVAGLESLPTLERRHIIETLDRVGWNRRRAAQILQISTTTLWRRLKDFGIEDPSRQAHAPAQR